MPIKLLTFIKRTYLVFVVAAKQGNTFLFANRNYTDSSMLLCVFFIGSCLPLFQSNLTNLVFIYGCCVLCLGAIFFYRRRFPVLIIVFAGLLGWCWTTHAFQLHRDNILPSELELIDLTVVGSVEGLPASSNGNVGFVFRVESSNYSKLKTNTLLKLNCYRCKLSFQPDQRWQLTLRLKKPHGYASWGAFDYEKYLFRHQFIAKGYVRSKGLNQRLDGRIWSADQLRRAVSNKLTTLSQLNSTSEFEGQEIISDLGLAMMLALGIGDKSLMSSEQRDVFQDSGVSHLMAISGLHIGLVFMVMSWICARLSYPFARLYHYIPRQYLVLVPALVSAVLYAALAGFAVSTVRALTMLIVFVFCKLWAREVSLHKVLLVAACVILLLDPFSILDVGFWLSCGAVFVIASLNVSGNAWSLLRLQPLLWLGMLPLSALFFGKVSLISPIVNLIAVPLFCLILIPLTLFSLCCLMLGLESVALFLLIFIDVVFVFIFDCLQWLTSFNFAKAHTIAWSYLHGALLVLALISYRCKLKIVSCVLWLLMIISLFFPNLSMIKKATQLSVSLLDVGQGLSMVIQVGEEDYTLVYDTGPRYPSGFSAANAVVVPFLRSRGVRGINRLIISHADNDHIGGYEDLIKAMPVNDVLSSRPDVLEDSTRCYAGQYWQVAEVHFEILSPDDDTPFGSNNLSCVLKITHGETSILITGDIEASVERHLMNSSRSRLNYLKADILLAPHHGSKTSSSPAFIDAVQPSLVLVSAGYLNRYKHAHPKVIARYGDRGIDLLSTADKGSVIIKVNRDGWSRVSYRNVNGSFWQYQKKPN